MKSIIAIFMIFGLWSAVRATPQCTPGCWGPQVCVKFPTINRCLANCNPPCGAGEICLGNMFVGICHKDCLSPSVSCTNCVNGYEDIRGRCWCTGDYTGEDCSDLGSECGSNCGDFGEGICEPGPNSCLFRVTLESDTTTTTTTTPTTTTTTTTPTTTTTTTTPTTTTTTTTPTTTTTTTTPTTTTTTTTPTTTTTTTTPTTTTTTTTPTTTTTTTTPTTTTTTTTPTTTTTTTTTTTPPPTTTPSSTTPEETTPASTTTTTTQTTPEQTTANVIPDSTNATWIIQCRIRYQRMNPHRIFRHWMCKPGRRVGHGKETTASPKKPKMTTPEPKIRNVPCRIKQQLMHPDNPRRPKNCKPGAPASHYHDTRGGKKQKMKKP